VHAKSIYIYVSCMVKDDVFCMACRVCMLRVHVW
jgi:hypothetical protein